MGAGAHRAGEGGSFAVREIFFIPSTSAFEIYHSLDKTQRELIVSDCPATMMMRYAQVANASYHLRSNAPEAPYSSLRLPQDSDGTMICDRIKQRLAPASAFCCCGLFGARGHAPDKLETGYLESSDPLTRPPHAHAGAKDPLAKKQRRKDAKDGLATWREILSMTDNEIAKPFDFGTWTLGVCL